MISAFVARGQCAEAWRREGTRGNAGATATLLLIPAVERAAYDRERYARDGRSKVQHEPDLGASAFSVMRGHTYVAMSLRTGTLAAVQYELPGRDPGQLKAFAKRVPDSL